MNAATAPDVTVVIPTYLRPGLLARCLDALLAQSLDASRYEVVVVDDGASADTEAGRRWFVRFFQDYVLREPRGVADGLGTIRVPTAIVWGDRDPYCPPWVARELAARIPDARLEWLAGADHYVMEERPADVLATLERWLARPAPAARPEAATDYAASPAGARSS